MVHIIPNVCSEYFEQYIQAIELQGYNSLSLIWFIHAIYLRPFLQNAYKEAS